MEDNSRSPAAANDGQDTSASTPAPVPVDDAAPVLPLQRNGVPRSHRERRYPCSMCSEVFTRQEHRRRHELSQVAASKSERTAGSTISDTGTSVHTPSAHSHHESIAGLSMVSDSDQRQDAEVPEPSDIAPDIAGQGQSRTANGSFAILGAGGSMDSLDAVGDVDGAWPLDGSHGVTAAAQSGLLSAGHAVAGRAAAVAAAAPPVDFQFLDDYLFQWLSADYMQMPMWSDGTVRLPTEQQQQQHLHLQQQHQQQQNQQNQQNQNLQPTADDRGEYQSSGLFWELTPADITQIELRLHMHDTGHRLGDFQFPSRYMTIRFLKAFFAYFLPHTPVVHTPTFHVETCPIPLLLAIMACGAIHVNEPDVGMLLHRAVLKLLSESEDSVLVSGQDTELQLWEFQTRLLACQFGLFSGDRRLRREARLSFPKLCMADMAPRDSWQQWIFCETIARCVAWVNTLSAVLLCDDETPIVHLSTPYIDAPLPCAEAPWAADATGWQTWSSGAAQNMETSATATVAATATQIVMMSSARQWLLAGLRLDALVGISPFGMLVLVSTLLSQICIVRATRRQPSVSGTTGLGVTNTDGSDSTLAHDETAMQTALATWEEAWMVHPQSTMLPEAPHGPLMADSILLLNTAYGRLYADTQVREMRALAQLPPGPLPAGRLEQLYSPNSLHPPQPAHHHDGTASLNTSLNTNLNKALVRACRSLLIRVRLGMRHMAKTASLTYACYGPLPAYEGSLLIAWYCLGQRLAKLPDGGDPLVARMLDEVVSESQYSQRTRVQRETIAMILYRDLVRERWIWKSCESIVERLNNTIQTFQLIMAGHGVA
ncbi:hypothetical protein SBRCBS47491_004723 [Sporothrix bragantina]|uniref:Xylanolytic transcriptional activator regulatory domain-containing protein n=1 Tax=Sporothrix bragantina TaxID=671064 RepID=A0ABP0BQS1_9PEZI